MILFLIQGLGKLAEKFPLFAKASVDCLREFLTNPSKILTRLHRQHLHDLEKNPPQVMVTKSDRFQDYLSFKRLLSSRLVLYKSVLDPNYRYIVFFCFR